MALLDTILKVIPKAHRGAIKDLLKRSKALGAVSTPRQELILAKKLEELLAKKGQVFIPRLASGKMSSEDHNNNMKEIYLDLFTLYTVLDVIGKAMIAQNAVLDSDYLKSVAAVQRLITDARTFALRKSFKEYNEIHILNFAVEKNFSVGRPKAVIGTKSQRLTLPPILTNRAHLPTRGEHVTNIYTRTVSPGNKSVFEQDLDPIGMVDQKPDTFWATLVMTDVPVKQDYHTSSNKKISVNGPVVEIYIQFSSLERINSVRILPFGDTPLSVVDVAYRSSPSSKIFRSLPLDKTEPTLNWVSLHFPTIYAAEIRISVTNESPRPVMLALPKSLVVNTDIFQHIVRERAAKLIGNVFFDSDLNELIQSSETLLEAARKDLERLIGKKGLQAIDTDIVLTEGILEALSAAYSSLQVSEDEIININKYEYLVGIRDIETVYEVYAPEAHYESEPYLPQATVSEISIEVDEERISRKNSWGTYYDSSTEWSIDLGEGRIIPIHPKNQTGKFGTPTVLDELLQFSRADLTATTRLGADTNNVLALRRDGEILPKSGYTVTRQVGVIPFLTVTLDKKYWNENSAYTVDYEVSPESYTIDILDHLEPRKLPEPETHKESGPNNDLILSRYPYIRYEIINQTGIFVESTGEAVWKFEPPEPVRTSGQFKIEPTVLDSSNSVVTTGNTTGYAITGRWGSHSGEAPIDTSQLNSNYLAGVSGLGYYIRFGDINRISRGSGVVSTSGLVFEDPPEFSLEEIKEMPSGAVSGFDFVQNTGYLTLDYELSVGAKIDERVFVFDDSTYEPITVTVAGTKAKNISNYKSLEHPAFSISSNRDRDYEYIHAGRRLYFNQPIAGEVRVDYEWLTQHLTVKGVLRSNKVISPDSAPQVEEIRLLINTSIL